MFDTLTRLGASGGDDSVEIDYSLRFDQDDGHYLERTPGSDPTSKNKYTFSCWVKRTEYKTGDDNIISMRTDNGKSSIYFQESGDDCIVWQHKRYANSTNQALGNFKTVGKFRDTTSWYHIVVAFDRDHSTTADKIIIWVNGVRQALTQTEAVKTDEDHWMNTQEIHHIGSEGKSGNTLWGGYFGGLMCEVHMCDGQGKTASDFGKEDPDTGQWIPKAYSGAYGTNGFYLRFQDNSGTSASTLGKDESGNGHNFTPTNFSNASGSGVADDMTDFLKDTPQNNGTVFVAHGTDNRVSTRQGGLRAVTNARQGSVDSQATVATNYYPRSGQWYYECRASAHNTTGYMIGWVENHGFNGSRQANEMGSAYGANGWGIYPVPQYAGKIFHPTVGGGWNASYGSAYSTSNVLGVCLDIDNETMRYYSDNTIMNATDWDMVGFGNRNGISPAVSDGQYFANATFNANFGQYPLNTSNGEPPTGYKLLTNANIPTPAVVKPGGHFNTVLWDGNGSTQSITGVGFSPDLVILKKRSGGTDRSTCLYDTSRGVEKLLHPTGTNAEETQAAGLTAFGADGFSLGSDDAVNGSSNSYVAWCWKEGTAPGFEIVTWTGDGNNRAISHNLGVAPAFMIVKRRDSTDNWMVYHKHLGNGSALELNETSQSSGGKWNSTSPTSSNFTVSSDASVNANNGTYVGYLFAEVEGFSNFGYYEGIGTGFSDDHTSALSPARPPYVYTGFEPAFVMIKGYEGGNTSGWTIHDNKTSTTNPRVNCLRMNTNGMEDTTSDNDMDFFSNGFKLRVTGNTEANTDGRKYVYAAFAKRPFKYSNAV